MERSDFIKIINSIENDFPVIDWKYFDMHIWPIVKKDIFFIWNDIEKPKQKKRKHNEFKVVLEFLNSIVRLLGTKVFLRGLDTVFLGASSHRVKYGNKFVNRYFYPLIEKRSKKIYLQLEYGEKKTDEIYDRSIPTVFLNNTIKIFSRMAKPLQQHFSAKELHKVFRTLESQLNLDLSVYEKDVVRRVNIIHNTAVFFETVFKFIKPKRIIGLCYYKNDMFGAHYAANKLGIENADMQHGGQGNLHPMYFFSKLPANGFNTLPETFYCWDNASANNIRAWLKYQQFHKVVVFGNPWIEFQLTRFQNKKLTSKKIVLYTLQEGALDPYILDAIKMTQTDYEWWLRLHPRMLIAKENIQRQLEDRNLLDFVEIEKATELPLPILLKNSSVHISKYSGSIIEAVQTNTPNIIIDKIGVDTYNEYVKSGDAKVVISKDVKELVDIINSVSQ